MDEYLRTAGATWCPGPAAGEWIGSLLDDFGSTLGHAVHEGYEAFVVAPIRRGDDVPKRQDYPVLDALIEQVAPFTGAQIVHTALWEGRGWLYNQDDDPRKAPGSGALVAGPHDDEALKQAQEAMAGSRVARPKASPLRLPGRNYFLWSGPLSRLGRCGTPVTSLRWSGRTIGRGSSAHPSTPGRSRWEPTSGLRVRFWMPHHSALGARRAERDEVLQGDG